VSEGAGERAIDRGATLITFYDTAYWGLPEMPYEDWVATVYADPRPYFDRMLDGMAEAGVDGIELAPAPGGWEGALRAYGSADGVRAELERRGLRLGSSYQNGAALIGDALDDPAREAAADDYARRHAEFVAALGASIIVMGTVPRAPFCDDRYDVAVPDEAMRRVAAQVDRLAAVAGEHGVRIALHTDAYSVCSRNADISRMLELTDPANVTLCLDAGHTTLDGGDAVAALRDHVGRTPVMHWKDCISPLDGATLQGAQMERHAVMLEYFRIFGDGIIDWRAWQEVLRDARWHGWAMAENDMAHDPIGEITAAFAFFDRELAQIWR
jgi:inosose dehydratase